MSRQERIEETIITDLKEQRTFRFSAAWRPRRSAALVVPVIRTMPRARGYLTIQEAKNVELQDTGSISAVKITNNEKLPLFVRVGSLLQGQGTQSRAVNKSVIIMPGETVDAEVNCVHQSHHIDSTAKFVTQAEHVAPAGVERELMSGDQRGVWGAVASFATAKQSHGESARGDPVSTAAPTGDNLVGNVSVKNKFTETVDELTTEIPSHEGQVGLVVLDERGVYGIEVFDSPDSWRVFNDAIVEKFAEVMLPRVDERVLDVRVKEENVSGAIAAFLDAMEKGQFSLAESEGGSQTVNMNGQVCCEMTFVSGEFVHLTAVRNGDDEAL